MPGPRVPYIVEGEGTGSNGSASRYGLTLIEVITTLGIICLLMALILPAVQSARESSRRLSCANRLKQIGIALEAFHASSKSYPAASTQSVNSTGQPIAANIAPHVELLPYLDQAALYQTFNRAADDSGLNSDPPTSVKNEALLNHPLEVYTCPSDTIAGMRCNYRICAGTSPFMHETTPRTPQAALQGFRSLMGRRDAEFVDGKSTTATFSERLAGDKDPQRYTASRDLASITTAVALRLPDDAYNACSNPMAAAPRHFSFVGSTWILSGYPHTWYNHILTPNSYIPDCVSGGPFGHGAYAARALHSGGVNTLFGDGSVRFQASSIDLDVWRALGTIAGGEAVSTE